MAERFEDRLPPGTVAVWTCGHEAGAVCAECYRDLARKAHELQEEVDRLRCDNRRLLEAELRRLPTKPSWE
jgi:hypothetical protein